MSILASAAASRKPALAAAANSALVSFAFGSKTAPITSSRSTGARLFLELFGHGDMRFGARPAGMDVGCMVGLSRPQNFGRAEFAAQRLESLEVRMTSSHWLAIDLVDVEGQACVMSGVGVMRAAAQF